MIEINEIRKNMAAILRKATVDEDFRKSCITDATKVYLELTGKVLPDKYKVRFCEPDSMTVYDDGLRQVCLPRFIPKSWLG